MKPLLFLAIFFFLFTFLSCRDKNRVKEIVVAPTLNVTPSLNSTSASSPTSKAPEKVDEAAIILARKEVPVLCYHQLREWRTKDSRSAKDYIVPPGNFEEQMKMLHDSGYKTILPEELMNYLQYGKPVPEKSFLLTFDDTDLSQYEVALPIMEKYGFKGTFFIMTVTMGKPGYMSREQISDLSKRGHEIGSHTWDHQNMKKLPLEEYATQVDKPNRQLKEITGKDTRYFAYPFGLWNKGAVKGLKEHHITAAFQLVEARDSADPVYTIRRMIVPGSWNKNQFWKVMHLNF